MHKRGPRSTTAAESALEALARRLGVPTGETAWLEHALTHRSYTREHGQEERESNERLEFLGDAIIQLAVSLLLYERYPRWTEGQLTRARSAVVSREPLVQAANRLNLGAYLRMGRTEDDLGGRSRPSILATAFEAVIAAVYVTSGMPATTALIRSVLEDELENAQGAGLQSDYKTRLQETCQAQRRLTPVYRTISAAGPDHARVFRAEVLVGGIVWGEGSGASKKDAEQDAARIALARGGPETPAAAGSSLPSGDGTK
jgi:ribonuclease III